jgi:hypothetical protein
VVDIDRFIRDLKRVRGQGYGLSDKDIAKGKNNSPPVRDVTGKVIATIGIWSRVSELSKYKIEPSAKSCRSRNGLSRNVMVRTKK